MDSVRWRQIDDLLDAALELPEAEREVFIQSRCNGDDELRDEVMSLLGAQDSPDNFLDQSVMRIAARNIAPEESVRPGTYLVDKTIGTYKIERLLGVGGMGEVYLAHDRKLVRKVALKILPGEFSSDDERLKRFDIEARAISALNHPNIVTIYDVGSVDGIDYIATEFVEGQTLRQLIGSAIGIEEILSVITQACDALNAAHSAGIIHRDIKPENIVVRPDGYVKVLDFGLAKLSESGSATAPFDGAKTAQGIIIGTPAYMSPDQVTGKTVDERTDLWSIAVVLYEFLTGKHPFKAENRHATLKSILINEPEPLSSFDLQLPSGLDQILKKGLEKDPDLGYQTASDMRADLKRIKREIDSSSLSWSQRSFELRQEILKRRGRKKLVLAGFGLFLAFIVAAGWYFLRPGSKTSAEATDWIGAKNIQVTETIWVEAYPSLSPDGKNIAFSSDSDDDRNIYLQRVGGKNPINLTPNSKGNDTMPVFSPDGKFIAFRSERQSGGVYIMEETGENVRRISEFGFHPSWSPDGKQIVVSDRLSGVHTAHTVPNSSLWVIDVATSVKRKLETKGDAIMPSWSPNGHRITFWLVSDGRQGDIASIPAAGGEPVVLDRDEASDWNPVWSSDGRSIYFASDRGGNMSFWRVAADEQTGLALGKAEPVPTPSKYGRHLTFSRDGKTLAYVRYESQSNLQSIGFDPKALKVNGPVTWITRGDKEVGSPDMSPDGSEFVIRHPSRTQEDLAVFDKNGGNWRALTNDIFRERVPRWSPDGKRIAFHSDRSGKYQIWSIYPDGTGLQQLTFTEKTGAIFAVYSPDGSHLVYTEINGESSSPFIIDLAKPWTEQIPRPLPPSSNNTSITVRDWSNDGTKLLVEYAKPDGEETGIGIFDLETGVYRKATDSGDNATWLNDNRNFIFTDRSSIFLFDSQRLKLTELYKPVEYGLQHANISADNKTLFFRYLQVDGDVWVLDASQADPPAAN